MDREEFIIFIFCLISDWTKKNVGKLRKRGPKPALGDDEVLTMEIVGEFFGLDTDKGIHGYFKCHWRHLFPKIGDRSAFVRQSANLWHIKQLLQRYLAKKLGALDDDTHIADGFPMPICQFGRAYFSQLFKGVATYGYCAAKKQTYYGFKGHLMISMNGVITGLSVAPANIDERKVALELLDEIDGVVFGDKGYIGKEREFSELGVRLETPLKSNMNDTRPFHFVKMMNKTRRKVETVIGQLSERFNIERIRARDMWHLSSRVWRKILAHTVCVFVSRKIGNGWLDFANLVCDG